MPRGEASHSEGNSPTIHKLAQVFYHDPILVCPADSNAVPRNNKKIFHSWHVPLIAQMCYIYPS